YLRLKDNKWELWTFQGWEEFTRFEYSGEIGKYFRIRLWSTPWHRKPQRASARLNIAGKHLLTFAPPVLTAFAAYTGISRFGFRADSVTALFLSLFYVMFFLMSWDKMFPKKSEAREPTDILFDNQVVTATELLAFLERRIPQMETGEPS